MNVNFSISDSPMIPPNLSLKAVWIMQTDRNYDVRKNHKDKAEIIALRTLGGSGKLLIEGCDEITVIPGTLIFIEHHKIRRYLTSSDTWNFRWFVFIARSSLHFPLNTLLKITENGIEDWISNECLNMLKLNSTDSNLLASAAFSYLYSKWYTQFTYTREINPYKRKIDEIILSLNNNYQKKITVKEMAKSAGLCERRFHDVFYQMTGCTPKKYIDTLKVKNAEELLRNTSLTIEEISFRLGYSSQFHFCCAFKKAINLPPSTYRKNLVKN